MVIQCSDVKCGQTSATGHNNNNNNNNNNKNNRNNKQNEITTSVNDAIEFHPEFEQYEGATLDDDYGIGFGKRVGGGDTLNLDSYYGGGADDDADTSSSSSSSSDDEEGQCKVGIAPTTTPPLLSDINPFTGKPIEHGGLIGEAKEEKEDEGKDEGKEEEEGKADEQRQREPLHQQQQPLRQQQQQQQLQQLQRLHIAKNLDAINSQAKRGAQGMHNDRKGNTGLKPRLQRKSPI